MKRLHFGALLGFGLLLGTGHGQEGVITLETDLSGKTYTIGQELEIRWEAEDVTRGFLVEFSPDGSENLTQISEGESLPNDVRSITWTIPDSIPVLVFDPATSMMDSRNISSVTETGFIRVCEYDGDCAVNETAFKIEAAGSAIQAIRPNLKDNSARIKILMSSSAGLFTASDVLGRSRLPIAAGMYITASE